MRMRMRMRMSMRDSASITCLIRRYFARLNKLSFSWPHENGAFSRFRLPLRVFQVGMSVFFHCVRSKRIFSVQSSKHTAESKNALDARFCAKENIALMRIYA